MRQLRASRRQAIISATEYPVELEWEPAGALLREPRQRSAADGSHARVAERSDQLLQPVDGGRRIVVKERKHFTARDFGRSIASRAKMAVVFVGHDGQRNSICLTSPYEAPFASSQQFFVVVYAQDYLGRRCGLGLHRGDGILEQ